MDGKAHCRGGLTTKLREYGQTRSTKPASQARGSSASCRQTFAVPLDVPRILVKFPATADLTRIGGGQNHRGLNGDSSK